MHRIRIPRRFWFVQDIPSAKVFGVDLVHYLDQNSQRHTASESIQAEIQDVFAEKEVRIRLPIEELKVLLLDETSHEWINKLLNLVYAQTVESIDTKVVL